MGRGIEVVKKLEMIIECDVHIYMEVKNEIK